VGAGARVVASAPSAAPAESNTPADLLVADGSTTFGINGSNSNITSSGARLPRRGGTGIPRRAFSAGNGVGGGRLPLGGQALFRSPGALFSLQEIYNVQQPSRHL
jgi:hypothetical protein